MNQYASNKSIPSRNQSNKHLPQNKLVLPNPLQAENLAPNPYLNQEGQNPPSYPPPPKYQNLPNHTLVTEVSMEGVNLQVGPQPIEHYQITPPCYHILFMLPFPCFMMGCCLSVSAYFDFNNQTRMLTLRTYCGHCACCASTENIPYTDIIRLKDEVLQTRYKRVNGGYDNLHQLVLHTKIGQFEISKPMGRQFTELHKSQLDAIMVRCGIQQQ